MYAENHFSAISTILILILSIYIFCVGIAQAIYTSDYTVYQFECSNVWYFNLVSSIINICIPIFTLCGTYGLLNEKDYKSFKCLKIFFVAHFAIALYALVVFFMIDTQCRNYWELTAPQMWYFVVIMFVNFWISLIIIAGLFIYGCVMVCSAVYIA